jgi:hypothetical protein
MPSLAEAKAPPIPFGSGPIRGFSFSPGKKADREQTLRGAFLQTLVMQDAGDLAGEWRLLNHHTGDTPLAVLIAAGILDRHEELAQTFGYGGTIHGQALEEGYVLFKHEVDALIDKELKTMGPAMIHDEGRFIGVYWDNRVLAYRRHPLSPVWKDVSEEEELNPAPSASDGEGGELVEPGDLPPLRWIGQTNVWEELSTLPARVPKGRPLCCSCGSDILQEALYRETDSGMFEWAHVLCVRKELIQPGPYGNRSEVIVKINEEGGEAPVHATMHELERILVEGRKEKADAAIDWPSAKKRKARTGRKVPCMICGEKIEAGDHYYEAGARKLAHAQGCVEQW